MTRRADISDGLAPSKTPKATGTSQQPAKLHHKAKPRQERARRTCAQIAQAAINVLAKQGLSRVTHRSVASEAGVALAATTYYYATKSDIIGAASSDILQHYVDSFERTALKYQRNPAASPAFWEFVLRQLRNVAGRDRMMMMAWQEISLDAVRSKDSLALMHKWHGEIDRLWTKIARASKTQDPKNTARSGVDTILGLLQMVCALSLTPEEIDVVFVGNQDPSRCWARHSHGTPVQTPVKRRSRKADGTRERLLDAAIEILINEGTAAIGYRAIAEHAGLTVTAPAYYFSTTASIIEAAQRKLFADSKARYGDMLHTLHPTESHVADITAAIFIREATEFAQVNLANRAIWIEAGRQHQLAPMVWSAISDQDLAWRRALTAARGGRPPLPRDGILAQALFLGKLQRVLSTGTSMTALAQIRAEFARDLGAIEEGRFWAQLG